MKIVFLNPVGTLGGGELSLLDIFASLKEQGPALELHLIVGDDGPLVSRARELGVTVEVLPLPVALARLGDASAGGKPGVNWTRIKLAAKMAGAGVSVLGYSRRLRARLDQIAPDVVHSNGFKMHVLAARSAPANAPVIWHVRDYLSSRPAMTRLLNSYRSRVAAIIANSASVAADVRSVCGDQVRLATVYNAIDLAEFAPEGEKLDLDQMAGLTPAPDGAGRIGGHVGPLEGARSFFAGAGCASRRPSRSRLRYRRGALSNGRKPVQSG